MSRYYDRILQNRSEFYFCWGDSDESNSQPFFKSISNQLEYFESKISVVGVLIDGTNPTKTNEQLIVELNLCDTWDQLFNSLTPLSGRYIIIAQLEGQTKVVGDACGSFEVFYHPASKTIASNASLIAAENDLEPWTGEAEATYRKIQNSHRVPVGTTTRYKGVYHLLPNHALNLNSFKPERVYPRLDDPIKTVDVGVAVDRCSEILEGTMQALANRFNLVSAVTAGYDSRLLLAASKNIDVETFIFKHKNLDLKHPDIRLGQKVAKAAGKPLRILEYDDGRDLTPEIESIYTETPRKNRYQMLINGFQKNFDGKCLIAGNIGEIGRSYYGNIKSVNAQLLAKLLGYKGSQFVEGEMQKWLDGLDVKALGEQNLLDLFYWEHRMGCWGAMAMTDTAGVMEVVAPMNNRVLLNTFLSVPKKYRTYYYSKLFDGMIEKLDKRLSQFPVNPGKKSFAIKSLVKLGLYDWYKNMQARLF